MFKTWLSNWETGSMNTVYFCMTPPQLSCPDIAFYAELTSQTTLTKGSKENAAYQLSTHCKTDLAGLKMDFDNRDSLRYLKQSVNTSWKSLCWSFLFVSWCTVFSYTRLADNSSLIECAPWTVCSSCMSLFMQSCMFYVFI